MTTTTLRRPRPTPTEIGQVEWPMKPCRELCVKIQDGTHFSPKLGGDDFLYVTSKSIRFGFLDLDTAERISTAEHRKIFARCDTRCGDLLLTKDGANTGNAALNTLTEEISLLSSVAFLRFDPSVHDARFFLQYVLSHRGQQRLQELMSGNAITRLTLQKIRNFTMPAPSLGEQRAIAAALSDVDGLIASLDRLIAKKRAIKQAAMQQLLAGKTRLPGFSGKWDTKPLRALADITMGQSPASVFYNLRGDGLPLIQGNADIEDRRSIARVWTTQSSKRCIAGDILLTVRAPVGAVGVASESACLGRGVCGLRPLADSSFLLQALVFAEPRWKVLEQGSTFTSANRTQVGQFELRVPLDPSEQHAIAIVLDGMDADLRSLEVRAAKTKAIKQGMMQALLTGLVRLPAKAAAGGTA